MSVKTEMMLMAHYGRVRITLPEVCDQLNIEKRTAYNKRVNNDFPIPMSGRPLTASISDVAKYLDSIQEQANKENIHGISQ